MGPQVQWLYQAGIVLSGIGWIGVAMGIAIILSNLIDKTWKGWMAFVISQIVLASGFLLGLGLTLWASSYAGQLFMQSVISAMVGAVCAVTFLCRAIFGSRLKGMFPDEPINE